MQTIPIINNKAGADNLIEQIRTKLLVLTWLGKSFPAVKDGYEDKLVYPACYLNLGTKDSEKIVPDNSEKSFIFFECPNSENSIEFQGDNIHNLNLICWYDLRKIDKNKTYDFSKELEKDVVSILKQFILVGTINVEHDYDFSKYSYVNKEKRQLLMHPYGAFKIDFKVISNC